MGNNLRIEKKLKNKKGKENPKMPYANWD